MTPRTVFLSTENGRRRAHEAVNGAPDDYVCRFGKATRTDKQNRKMHPMIADIQRQVPEMQEYSAEDIKLQFLNALGVEMRFLPTLERQGMFPVGMKSSTLTVEQFAGLIELLYAYGARHGVEWSDETRRNAA